jgi:DNA-directed RNA polymerase subunit M/transcription elongation factor TFIIS
MMMEIDEPVQSPPEIIVIDEDDKEEEQSQQQQQQQNVVMNEATIIRRNMRNLFQEKLNNERWATNLEIGVFNATIDAAEEKNIPKQWESQFFVELYKSKCRSVYSNLSEEVLSRVIADEIKPHEIAFMTHQQLDPAKWKPMIDTLMKREASKYETFTQAMTDMYTCSKCKSKRTIYRSAQVRSADEPETIFVTCLDCGKKWKR